jgi:hypothetical protein
MEDYRYHSNLYIDTGDLCNYRNSYELERKGDFMNSEGLTEIIIIFVIIAMMVGGLAVIDAAVTNRCVSWYENTGGDFILEKMSCQVRINSDTYVQYNELYGRLAELDLSYVKK